MMDLEDEGAELEQEGEPGPRTHIIESYPLPPVFCVDDPKMNQDTAHPIEVVLVSKKGKDRQFSYVDFRPIEKLQTLDDLLDQFGPGTFLLSGRLIDRRTIVLVRMQTVGHEESEEYRPAHALAPQASGGMDLAKLIASLSALAGPVIALLQQNAEARRAEARAAQEREQRHHETLMQTVVQCLNARMGDIEGLANRGGAGAGGGGGSANTYRQAMEDALALIETLKGEGDTDSRVLDLLQSFATGAKQGQGADPSAIAQAAQMIQAAQSMQQPPNPNGQTA